MPRPKAPETVMKVHVLLALMLGAAVAPLSAQVEAPAATATVHERAHELAPERRLRLGTWNLLNVFDDVDEPGRPDEGTDPKSWIELGMMARAIDDMDVDVLGVQEVENRRVLERLNERLERPFAYVELIEGNDHRGIDVGLLSRLPITAVTSHRLRELGDGRRFARDFPLFRVTLARDRAIEIGVVHLKSKRGKSATSDAWRRAEAEGIRGILDRRLALDPKTPLVVMGDFNDTRDATSLEPLFTLLADPSARLVPDAGRWTYAYRGEREQIDYILVTRSLDVRAAHVLHRDDSCSDHAPLLLDVDAGVALERAVVAAGLAPAAPARPELRADDLAALRAYLLKEVRMVGTVTDVFRPRSGGAVLNFLKDYRKACTVFVPRGALERFPDLEELVGARIAVSGPVSRHRDVLQIRLAHPEQIERL